jgi:hypothetical protein
VHAQPLVSATAAALTRPMMPSSCGQHCRALIAMKGGFDYGLVSGKGLLVPFSRQQCLVVSACCMVQAL